MNCATLQATSTITAVLSALAAVFSATTAWRSFQLARSLRDELKSDERLVFGSISHPSLRDGEHAQAVIQLPIFNKSKRKAYIDALSVFDGASNPIETTWSDEIDGFGNPITAPKLIGIVDSATLYIRRNDGKEISCARISLRHSFSAREEVLVFDPSATF